MTGLLLAWLCAQTPAPLMPVAEKPRAEPAPGPAFRKDFTGQDIFLARCAACHGVTGEGNGGKMPALGLGARNLTSPDWQDVRTDEQIRDGIMNGLGGTKMRAFKKLGRLEQFDQLVALIRSMRAPLPLEGAGGGNGL